MIFQDIAGQTDSEIKFDFYDPSVIEIKSDDFKQFMQTLQRTEIQF